MQGRWGISIVIGTILLCTMATHASAQNPEMPGLAVVPHVRLELLRPPPNEAGVTLATLFDGNLWGAMTHPLQSDQLNTVAWNVHRTPRTGLQFQLLTPGIAGITIHLRW